jgi:hypothetical protein
MITLLEVLGMLAGVAVFLWFSAYIESRHLGPLVDQTPVMAEPAVGLTVVEAVQTAA